MTYNLYHQEPLGRAESIKLTLFHAKAEYTVHAHPVEELKALVADGKIQAPFGDFPVLEHNGKYYAKVPAILRYLGRVYGLYPTDLNLAYQVDSSLESVRDLVNKLAPIALETDEEVKKAKGVDALANFIPTWLAAHEKRLADRGNENFLVGDSLTVADTQFYGLIRVLFRNDKIPFAELLGEVFAQFPKLNAYADNIAKHFEGFQ
jgi:glutathione S-transferase